MDVLTNYIKKSILAGQDDRKSSRPIWASQKDFISTKTTLVSVHRKTHEQFMVYSYN